MKREEKLNSIFIQFDKLGKQFCDNTNGLFCEILSEYKGEEKAENLKYRFAKIYYKSFIVKFIYTAHGIMSTVNSILSCSVCFDKTQDSIEIPLPLATDYCDMNFETPMIIPFITGVEAMTQAFNCIDNVLKKSLNKFENISQNQESKSKLLTLFSEEIKNIFDLDISSEMPEKYNEIFNNFFNLRFCSDSFINALKGDRDKAVKQLIKVKKMTGYEKRMLNLWTLKEQNEFLDLSVIVTNADKYNEKGVPKTSFKEFSALFLSWMLLTPIASAIYIGIFFLIVFFEGRESVYLMGPIYNFPYCILFGFITAIAISYFTRFKFYKLFYKKDYEKYCEMDYIQNGGSADKLMKRFLTVIIVIGVVGCVFFAKWNLNFLDNGFIDNSKFFSLQGEYYDYSDIERVYYKADRTNDFNETIEFPSYVLVLKNGIEIDLYEHGEISDYEKVLINYFVEKGIKIDNSNS